MPVVIYMVFRPENGSVKSAGHASVLIVDSPPSQQTPSASFSYDDSELVQSPLPDYESVDIEDLELRQMARPLHSLDFAVVSSEKGHPAIGAVCEVCGKGEKLLSHCGRPLCIPCMKKKAGRKAVLLSRALIEIANRRRYANIRPGLRLLGLTIKTRPGHLKNGVERLKKCFAELRRRTVWTKTWNVEGVYARMEWTLTQEGWHIHIHAIIVSKFIPAGPDFAKEGEPNLRDVWHDITGDSFIVDLEEIEPNPSNVVHEVEKYLVKPISETEERIQNWPLETRQELAEVIAGPHRTNWYCPVHHSHTRKKCLDYRPQPGMKMRRPCEGEYRKERQGFRVFAPTGSFRKVMRDVKANKTEKNLCRRCGLGRVRNRRFWKDAEYMDDFGNASVALNLIEAHETTDRDLIRHLYSGDPTANLPMGWHPPPGFEGYDPKIALGISQYLRERPRTIEWMLETLCANLDQRLVLKVIDGQLKIGNWVESGEYVYLSRRRGN